MKAGLIFAACAATAATVVTAELGPNWRQDIRSMQETADLVCEEGLHDYKKGGTAGK